MPRILPDGTRNEFHIQRLKDKLGNRSNASSEVEFHGAWARMVGEPGRGVPTIIEMVGHTRLDCVIGSAAGMRSGVVSATWHTAHRSAFGKVLIDQPLMRNVLADLCVESEATTALAMRLARAYDEAHDDADAGENETDAQLFKRLATAVGKYWTCKRAPNHAFESLECLGGAGYVEESGHAAPLPRGAAGLDLGGLGQRHEPRRAARADALAALARGVPRTRSSRPRGADAPPRRARRGPEGAVRRPRDARDARPPRGRIDGAVPAGLAARAPRRPRRGRRLLRVAARPATAASSTARCRAGVRLRGDHRALARPRSSVAGRTRGRCADAGAPTI